MDDATAAPILSALRADGRRALSLLTIGCDPQTILQVARQARRQGFTAVEGLALVPSRALVIAGSLAAFREQDPGTGLSYDDGDILSRLGREEDATFDIAIVGQACDDRLRRALDRVVDRWFAAPPVAQLSSEPSFNTLAPLSCSIR